MGAFHSLLISLPSPDCTIMFSHGQQSSIVLNFRFPLFLLQSSPYNHGSPCDANKVKAHENTGVEQFQGGSESVLSTVHSLGAHDVISKDARARQMYDIRKTPKRTFLAVMFALFFILLAFGPSPFWKDVNFEIGHLVPT